jgi:Flp pilus assembly protein TadD
VTYACYRQVGECGFVHLDDDVYITNNPRVQFGLNRSDVAWAFKPNKTATWQPLVWLSYMLDSQFSGVDPAAFHQTNLLLHVANVVLLLALLLRATGALWPSAFVAALFALHPQHVESVAWVAERKDVLSTFFWFAAMLAYIRYAGRPGLVRYGVVFVLYALGLMAKPMLVTLPVVLLLMDYWPLRRLQGSGAGRTLVHLIWEKAPLLALAAASSVITYFAQKSGGAVDIEGVYPFGIRLANAVVSYWVYISKTVWPAKLAVFYPHPRASLPRWEVVASAAMLVLATYAAVRVRRRFPYITVGWLWYLTTLLPVLGLVQIGMHGSADRFTYVPHIGLFIILAWGAGDVVLGRTRAPGRVGAGLVSALVVVTVLAASTYRQVGYWRNDITLFTHAVEAVPGNYVAHDNLGTSLLDQGDVKAAMAHYREAIRIEPDYLHARRNLMSALIEEGKPFEAVECVRDALRVRPNDPDILTELAVLYLQQSKLDAAEGPIKKALRIRPDHAGAHHAYGVLLAERRRIDEAIAHFKRAVQLAPGDSSYRADLDRAKRIKAGEQ